MCMLFINVYRLFKYSLLLLKKRLWSRGGIRTTFLDNLKWQILFHFLLPTKKMAGYFALINQWRRDMSEILNKRKCGMGSGAKCFIFNHFILAMVTWELDIRRKYNLEEKPVHCRLDDMLAWMELHNAAVATSTTTSIWRQKLSGWDSQRRINYRICNNKQEASTGPKIPLAPRSTGFEIPEGGPAQVSHSILLNDCTFPNSVSASEYSYHRNT